MRNPLEKKKKKKNQIIINKPTYLPTKKLKNMKTNENQRNSHKWKFLNMNNFIKKMKDRQTSLRKKNGAPTNWKNENEIQNERIHLYSFIFKNLLSFIFFIPCFNPHHEIIINSTLPWAGSYFKNVSVFKCYP